MYWDYFNKALIVILVLFLLSGKGYAQTYSNKESCHYGFSLGMTSSNLLKDSVKFKSGILFSGGLVYNLALSEKLNLGVELLYTGKAFKSDSPIIKYRFYYVDLPVYLQYNLTEGIRLNLGGQYSKFINSNLTKIDGYGKGGNGSHTFEHENIKDMDYSFLLGAEIDLGKNLVLGARYTISGSTFFEQHKPNFGVFQLNLKMVAKRSYKQIFGKKSE